MTHFEVIPAIDLLHGKVVRLEQGDFKRVHVYSEDPVAQAKAFVEAGAQRLHVVDLEGARTGKLQEKSQLQKIVQSVSIPVQIGGGIRDLETIRELLALGVDRVILGTAVLKDPSVAQTACKEFGDRLYISLDAKGGDLATEGWTQTSGVKATEWIKGVSAWGMGGVVYTDISRDGMLQGPNFQAIRELAESTSLPIIASGGVSTKEDVQMLRELAPSGVCGCIIGKALYAGTLTLQDLPSLSQ